MYSIKTKIFTIFLFENPVKYKINNQFTFFKYIEIREKKEEILFPL